MKSGALIAAAAARWSQASTGIPFTIRKKADVLTVLLHESGHSVRLLHDSSHPEAVMWSDGTCKQTLRADDKAGIDALY